MHIETLTAATAQGRQAIETVMAQSYRAQIDDVPPDWALARVVDSVPVAFILVDPDHQMAFPTGDLRYAFICDVATREDRRYEGHFHALMENAFARLLAAGISLVLTHGRYPLYRRFGFDVFTHHSGIFITPEQVERTFVAKDHCLKRHHPSSSNHLIIAEGNYYLDDLLVITDVTATTLSECKATLITAASIARERDKQRILIEHPAAPSYGSRYPVYTTLDTPLVALARTCGAEIRVQGADPESGNIPDADWIKVLDVAGFLRAAVACRGPSHSLHAGRVGLDTDAGAATIEVTHEEIFVIEGIKNGVTCIKWPSTAIAQLVTGYRSAATLNLIHNTALSGDIIALLDALFPPGWRFSRNESWTYKA